MINPLRIHRVTAKRMPAIWISCLELVCSTCWGWKNEKVKGTGCLPVDLFSQSLVFQLPVDATSFIYRYLKLGTSKIELLIFFYSGSNITYPLTVAVCASQVRAFDVILDVYSWKSHSAFTKPTEHQLYLEVVKSICHIYLNFHCVIFQPFYNLSLRKAQL